MSISCQLRECGRVGLLSQCKRPATTERSRIMHLTHRMRNNKLLFLRALQFGVLCYAVAHNQNTTLSLYNVIFCKPFVSSNLFLFLSDTSLSLISWHRSIRANPRVLPAWDADQPPFLASLQRTYQDQDGVQGKGDRKPVAQVFFPRTKGFLLPCFQFSISLLDNKSGSIWVSWFGLDT